MQFEAKIYKNQRKRFAEVTGNFLSSLIKKTKTKQNKNKAKKISKLISSQFSKFIPRENIRKSKPLIF